MKSPILLALFTVAVLSTNAFAAEHEGGQSGGGGDATEMSVDLIRIDILKWIGDRGYLAFKDYPVGVTPELYAQQMTKYLAPHFVVVGFVTLTEQSKTQDPEQKVEVGGNKKTCRGFISTKDRRPHILCLTERYPEGGDDQYRLIHHEFAGLARVERNVGASSDYTLSEQLTDHLVPETIYRLSAGPKPASMPDGYDEKGHPYHCQLDTEDKDANETALNQLLKTQKTCVGANSMFETCRQGLGVYEIIDISVYQIIPKCERSIKKDVSLERVYKHKSKLCVAAGETRQDDASSNECQRDLAVELGSVAELSHPLRSE